MRTWIDKLFKRALMRPAPRRRPHRVFLRTEELEPRWTPSLVALASLLDGPDGINPYGTPIVDSNGNLFGTTFGGNPSGAGTVYEVNNSTGNISTLAVFTGTNGANPEGGLVMDSAGNLFGTTSSGGSGGEGTLFEIPSGGTLQTLVNFNGSNGSNPSNETLLLDTNGNLFGTTRNGGNNFTTHQTGYGTVFELPKGAGAVTTLASFNNTNGSLPFAGLIEDSKGDLFGTTSAGGTSSEGTVFEVMAGSNTITTLANFSGTNGDSPECTLFMDSLGNLFGTTVYGGITYTSAQAPGDGTVFELPAGSSTIMSLASFNAGIDGWFPRAGLVQDTNGNFFGTALYGGNNYSSSNPQQYPGFGSLFEFMPSTDTLSAVVLFSGGSDGGNPSAGLVQDASGNFFGACVSGGPENLNYGTVFELPSGSTSVTEVAAFPGSVGAAPYGGLVQDSNGNLFGAASEGGPLGEGSVFELAKGSSTITALATFNGSNGADPQGNLIIDSNGNLFGTTVDGGGSGLGTVFELPAGSNTIQTLVSFSGTNGEYPNSGLIEDSNGNLFGTTFGSTSGGGSTAYGTIFEVLNTSNTLVTLGTFSSTGGTNPQGGLVADSNGNLFGATVYGGPSGYGTIFELPAGSSTIQTLANFNGSNGAFPLPTLLLDSSGNLFGTAFDGGLYGVGTVFELKQGSATITDVASFSGGTGAYPFGGLIETTTGMLIGTTAFGGIGYAGPQTGFGTVFEVPSTGGTITAVGLFQGTNGSQPAGTLLLDKNGNLIGPTVNGGSAGFGTIFELNSVPALAITTTTLPNGSVNVAYNQTIQASGGTGSYTFSTTSGTLPAGLTLSTAGVLSGTPTTAGGYSFTVTAKDSSGQTASQAYTVSIFSQASVLAISVPSTATAGTSFTITITAQDGAGNTATNYNGTVTLSSSQGPDISPTTATLTNGTATVTVTLTGAGSQTITASATGLTSGTGSVTVSPGPFDHYVMTIVGGSSIQAGTQFLVTVQAADKYGNSVSSYSGPAVTPTVTPSTGASFPSTVSLSAQGFGLFLVTLNKVGSYTISVSGGSAGSNTGSISVTPGAPAAVAFGAQPQNTPTGVTLAPVTVQVVDRYGNVITTDNTDPVVLSVASGPGPFSDPSAATATVTAGVATFNNLVLTAPGTYALSAVVPASYTGPNSSTFTIAPLQVVPGSFAGTPSGFSVQFNAPLLINSTTPVLYGASTLTTPSPAPSVIVTTDPANLGDTAAYVAGSLVLSASNTGLTFVATNTTLEVNNGAPILPDGTYTVIVRGSAANNGLQAAGGGGYLDGKGTGTAGSGDYVATFTVSASHDDVVWVPPTADGPGQSLNGPGLNQLASGYPVYLSDTTGNVTLIHVILNYDPTLLTVTGVRGAGFSLSTNSTAGHAVLIYNGPALPAGSQTLIGYVTATVPGGTVASPTPYKAKDLLHLTSVNVNSGAIQTVTSDGLHLVAYVGDADGNGNYTSGDAVLITRAILVTDTGFAAYPLVDPTVLADTDGSGFVSSDAPLQVNEAGVGARTANLPIPPLPAGVHFQPVPNNVDPTLSVDRGPWTVDRSTVPVAVNIDDAHPAGSTGLIRAHLALTYDPSQFMVSAADVHAGSLLAGGDWSIVPSIDPTTGQIGITLSSDTPITSAAAGSLVTIDFHAVGRTSSPPVIDLVASASPNGQFITTELEDAQGTFTLTPAPSNAFDPRLARVITLAGPSSAKGASIDATDPAFGPVASVAAADSPSLTEARPTTGDSADFTPVTALAPAGDLPVPALAPEHVIVASAIREGIGLGLSLLVSAASTATLPAISSLGLALPLTAWPTLSAPTAAAHSVQPLSDPPFPAWTSISQIDAAITTTRDALEHVLSSSLLRVPAATDTVDILNGGQLGADPLPVWTPDLPTRSPASTEAVPPVDAAPMDRCFAQMSYDWTTPDDAWLTDAFSDET